jgi:NAD dependent epimerase/dehydratase family enzyme
MASMVLASVRLDPSKLVRSGFEFRYPELDGALRAELGRQGQDGREA